MKELQWEEVYHRNRLTSTAVDVIFHKVAPEVKLWLEGGPKPRRSYVYSPSNMAYRTRSNVRLIEMRNREERPPLPPRILQYGEGSSHDMPIGIDDSDSDSD